MPNQHDDDDHAAISTTTIAGTTSSISVPVASSPPGNPIGHPDRPIKTKPSSTAVADGAATTSAGAVATSSASSSWLPSFFPTFSAKTQVWIYGAAGLIATFCGGLGIYFFIARRRRLRNNPRDEWEFDMLQQEEADGLTGGPRTIGAGKKGGKRRAGELYDAFAAGTDDEDEGEYVDSPAGHVGGDEREKKLYDDDSDGEGHHVVGEESDAEEEDEKAASKKLVK